MEPVMPASRARGSKTGERADIYQEVTHRVIAALENGTVLWQKPWRASTGPPEPETLPVRAGSQDADRAVVVHTVERKPEGTMR
jgi:antirestriction protein ArdC